VGLSSMLLRLDVYPLRKVPRSRLP
jgi:hypothetical protein